MTVSAASSTAVHRRAPAKVNLSLAVLSRRPDGFHEIESWVVQVGWFDDLVFSNAGELSLEVDGASAGVPSGRENLVFKAAEALAREAGFAGGARIELHKEIPVGAGLGGGSSDAATTLLGLNQLWGLRWPLERLIELAAKLGSDVPLFLGGVSSIIRGRGEKLEPLASTWRGWFALIVPPYRLSTAEVYRLWTPGGQARAKTAWARPATAASLAPALFNDLEAAAFKCEPRLAALHAVVNGLDGRPVRMTGSGACLYAAFDARAEAEAWGKKTEALIGAVHRVGVVSSL